MSTWQTMNWRSDFVDDGKLRCRIIKEYNWTGSWTLANETHLVYDGMLVVQERDGSNNAQVSYTRGSDLSGGLQGAGGIGGLLAREDATQTNALFQSALYHCDGNGNITALASPNGLILASYLYDPYGRPLAQSGPLADANLYRFSSKMWAKNADIYYYGYRFYSPNLQRWLNCDPIQEKGGINLYAFVNDNPVNKVDPKGLSFKDDVDHAADVLEAMEPGGMWATVIRSLSDCNCVGLVRHKLNRNYTKCYDDALGDANKMKHCDDMYDKARSVLQSIYDNNCINKIKCGA